MPHTSNIIGSTQGILITLLNQVGGIELVCVHDTRFNKLSGYHIVRHIILIIGTVKNEVLLED